MYYINCRLIEALPKLLGKSVKQVLQEVGTSRDTYARWCKGKIPCSAMVRVCNIYRISISSFLVLKSEPELMKRATDYVRMQDSWCPVEWDSRPIANLFGPGGLTGVPGVEAAKRLGFASKQIFDRWANEPDNCRMDDLVRLMNEFKVDASLFFLDNNMPIPLPAWEVGNKHIADIVADRMEGYRKLEKALEEKERENRSLRGMNERLTKENLRLREKKEVQPEVTGSVLKESPVKYGNPFGERGYVFHEELWENLHNIADMSRMDFCKAIGVNYNSSYRGNNVQVTALVKACNMLRISVSHFFVPKNEVPVMYDGGFYIVSPRLFVPIEDRMDNLRYIFGRYGVTDLTIDNLNKQGVWQAQLYSMARRDGPARVLTLCDICTTLNISPNIFFKDENRHKAVYSQSANERLLLNAIAMAKEIEALRLKIKRLKEKDANG